MTQDQWQHSTIGEQTFVHLDTGDGPAVVLVHGFPDLPESWRTIQAALNEAGYRTIVPHLRGYHPDTVIEGRHYRPQDLAADAVGLLDALGVETATLVGHDFGASVAYAAAALAPERFDAVVPIAVPHPEVIKPTPRLAWMARHFVTHKLPGVEARARRNDFAYVNGLISRWAPDWTGPERDATFERVQARFADPVVLHEAFNYYRDLSPKRDAALAPPLQVRALVVADDQPELADGYRATVAAFDPPADLLVLPGTGHWPHREAEPAFIERLLAFLDD